ncbi:response regulator, partial [Gottfriedia acidiceleris]|uniref:response regulator n=1 Tax=Gottfriedia acidiceleris TaxID=371036 RepID=UPI002FFE061B
MNILIADDEKDMLKILEAYFKKEGYNVFLAEEGEQAIEIFYSEKIDLAIL